MVKLVVIVGVITAAVFGAALSLQNYLTIDDLQNCPAPSFTYAACAPADAIVAISGGDTQARTAEAISLYKAGWAPILVFSGAALDASGPSNAEAMRRQALAAGVQADAILLDSNAADTTDNARNVVRLLGDSDRVILVTSPYHQRRAYLEFTTFFGKQVTVVNHPTSTDRYWPTYWWLTANGWWLAIVEGTKTLVVSVGRP